MKPRWLLDTNMLSAAIRDPRGPVARRWSQVGTGAVTTSAIVAAELRFGAAKAAHPELARRIAALLQGMAVLPWSPPADAHYAAVRLHLEEQGRMIGPNDLLIAAHALAEGLVVVTANEAEFQRVPELEVENWARSA